MFNKKVIGALFALAFMVVGAASSYAQGGPVYGEVKLKKADGTEVPVEGALIEAYRTDTTSGKLPSAKTNSKGEFSFASIQHGHVYAIAVSAPGAGPRVTPDIKAGGPKVLVLLDEGDGRRVEEDEVRELIKVAGMSEEERKKSDAEYQKQLEKYNAEKKKAEDNHKIVSAALDAGDKAFNAKDYNTAIAKFDEGINADPDFEGSAPVLLNYKGVALRLRGFEAYRRSAQAGADRAAEMATAKADLNASADAFARGLEILNTKTNNDASIKENMTNTRKNILTNFVETHRLLVLTKADSSRVKDAIPIFAEYQKVETDKALKVKAMVTLGDILREAGEADDAITAYRAVLVEEPKNADSLAGLGLSLFNVGVSNDNKEQMQEGLNLMQSFVESAPDSHSLKASVQAAIEFLKTDMKMTPQKRGR
ncbi:MAG: tetratricopeptide repeat protein [Acidobacteria bacterium]|nr:tetratricopeptide repeat protein [Acidobacteriota bacterium]